ncbi:MAG: OmpA family protein, partial [Candidatus Thiodiazotropha sp.]
GQGGGPITFEQGGAGFRIQPDGTVDLFGKTVSLGGPNGVNFNGDVNYEVPGSAKAPNPSVCGPIECPPIAALSDSYVPGVCTPPTFFEILYSPNSHEIILLDEQGLKQLELYEQRLDKAAQKLEAARTQQGDDNSDMLAAQQAVRKELRVLSGNGKPEATELAPLVKGKVSFQEMIRIGKAKYSLVPNEFLEAFRKKPRHYYTLPRDIAGAVAEVVRKEPEKAKDAQRGWRYTAADEALNPKHKAGKVNLKKVRQVFGQIKSEIKQDWELAKYEKSGRIPTALVARGGMFPLLSTFLNDDDFTLIDQWIDQVNEDANVSSRCYEKYRQEALQALDKNTNKDEKNPDNYFKPEDWDIARRMVGDIWGEKCDLYLDMKDVSYRKIADDHIRALYRDKIAHNPLPPTHWDASAGAQLMRYSLGITLDSEFDLLKKGKLAINGKAKLDASLAEAKADGGFFIPNSNGWKLRPKVPVRSDRIEYKPIGKSANQDQSENRGFVQLDKSEHLPYFAVDSSLITPSGASSIFLVLHHWSMFKQTVNRYQNDAARRDLMVQVVGHTSATGSEGYNQALGMRRAAIVAEFIRQTNRFDLWMSQFAQGHWGQDEADFMAYAIVIMRDNSKIEVDWDAIVTPNHKVSLVAQLKQQVPDLDQRIAALTLPEQREVLFLPRERWSEIKTDSGHQKPMTRLAYLIQWYVDRVKYHAYGKAGLQEDLFKKVRFYSEPYISKGETDLAQPVDSEAFQNRRCDFVAWEIDTEKSHKVYTQTPVNFGEFRMQVRGHISGWAGANIELGGELAIATPKGMMAAVGAIRDVKNQGRVGKQTIKGGKGALSAGSNAAAFAGAKAELGLKGSADWRAPPEQPKYGEKFQPSDFQSLGSIGYTLTGMVGIGGKFDLKIGFDQTCQRFVMRFAAEACLGPGFGGQVDITVGIGQCWDFITLVHGQLKRHDFSYMDFFEKGNDESGVDVFELFSAWAWKMLKSGNLPAAGAAIAVGASAEMVVGLLIDFRELLVDWENSEVIQKQTDKLIDTLHEKPELLRYLTPETKGRILYDLLSVPIDWSERLDNWTSLDLNKRREEAALILIQEGVISWADWRETLEHIGEIKNGRLTPRITPNATHKQKAQRVRDNLAWLQSELLNDEEDWNALQSHLRTLPAQE